jgi:ABC-type multidrug transport system fused ATPase/permease subunit
LKDIRCSIAEGQTIALIGRSGSGKTTLLRTLVGFLPEYTGQILIGQQPLSEMTRKELNQKMGIIFQDPFIFKGTLYDNISLGDLSATEEEVYEAACQAKLGEWIDQLPHGLYTEVDQKGAKLSGGQRQRIALARMFLKKPDILLLDEPTSALDQLTEKEIMNALGQLMKGKTTVIATHRLQTIINADQIIVFEEGRIIEAGTHEQLLQQSARYAQMLASFAQQDEHQPVGGVS